VSSRGAGAPWNWNGCVLFVSVAIFCCYTAGNYYYSKPTVGIFILSVVFRIAAF